MYTINTPYEQEVVNLRKSCERFKIDLIEYPVKGFGIWAKNCQIKSKIILKALSEYNCDIVWIDADAVFNKYPGLFDDLSERNDFDICCHYLKTKYNPNELLSGTLYFKNTCKSKEIILKWIELNETNSEWDQRNLQKVIDGDSTIVKVNLPSEYIKIDRFTQHQGNINNPVITHFQASRRFKNKKM